MTDLTWLHLSDWHQQNERFDRKVVCDALIEDIENRRRIHKDLETIDFIVLSGDVAFSGKKEEYQKAVQHLIEPILKATSLDESQLFIVPGNHDLDKSDKELLVPAKYLDKNDDIKEWLTNEKRRKLMLPPFEAYEEFVKPYAKGTLSAYASSYEFKHHDKTIMLMGFNSALICGRGDSDYGKLIIGEPQVYKTLENAKSADIRIAVMHHPFEYLTEADRTTVESRLKKDSHFILFGHQHRGTVAIHRSPEGDCILIPAGAIYKNRIAKDSRYINSYNFVHLDFENNQGTAYLRQWSEDDKVWSFHKREAHLDGTYKFQLPKDLCTRKEEPKDLLSTPITSDFSDADFNLDNPVFNLQYRAKEDGMVGREDALKRVREQLLEGKRTAIGHTAAFLGLGGLGKTQLAVEYAHRFREQYPKGVIWLTADQDIDAQLIQVAKQAKWISHKSEHSDILNVALRRLKTKSDCLIIFDNVEKYQDIEPYLPVATAEPHLLLTSRAPQKGFIPIPIELLNEEQSLQLLLKESCRDLDSFSEAEKKAAHEIAKALAGLPLAIEIAGAYLNYIPKFTFQNYLTILRENFDKAMAGDQLFSFTGHKKNLYATLRISQQVLDRAPLLEEILNLLTWSGSSSMGISLIATILDKPEADLYHALGLGTSLRVLHKPSEEDRYAIHRLVCQVRQKQFPITDNKNIQWIKDKCQRLGDWFEERRTEYTDLLIFEKETDHLNQWLNHVAHYSPHHTVRLTWLQTYPLYQWGKYHEAHELAKSAFSQMEKLPKIDQKLKANILDDLGSTFSSLGNYKEGLMYQKNALEIRQQLFGENHPNLAISLNNVGHTNSHMGNHLEALKYLVRALEIRKKFFGENHSNTATSFNNVGYSFYQLGNYQEAIKYQIRALEIRQQLLGENHPDTARSFNNVANTYFKLKQYNEALNYSKKAFQIRSRILEEHHPDTANSLNNHAVYLTKLKKFKEATALLKNYLKHLPYDHQKYQDLVELLDQIRKESGKSGFRPKSGTQPHRKKKKKKKKR
jgi:tetratricopeptide (TPR) repeat protein